MDVSKAAYVTAGGGAGQGNRAIDLPEGVTNEIMNRVNSDNQTANEIFGRLHALRDRLFGSPPESGSEARLAGQPSAFADAWRDRSIDLTRTLNSIDQITIELSNRL